MTPTDDLELVETGSDAHPGAGVHLQRRLLLGVAVAWLHAQARVTESKGEALRMCPSLTSLGRHEVTFGAVTEATDLGKVGSGHAYGVPRASVWLGAMLRMLCRKPCILLPTSAGAWERSGLANARSAATMRHIGVLTSSMGAAVLVTMGAGKLAPAPLWLSFSSRSLTRSTLR